MFGKWTYSSNICLQYQNVKGRMQKVGFAFCTKVKLLQLNLHLKMCFVLVGFFCLFVFCIQRLVFQLLYIPVLIYTFLL